MGLEPTTTGITIRALNQLGYAHHAMTAPILYLRRRLGAACSLSGLARPTGIEPVTPSLEGWCSIRLSYGRKRTGTRGSRGEGKNARLQPLYLGPRPFELGRGRPSPDQLYTPSRRIKLTP